MKTLLLITLLFITAGCAHPVLVKDCDPIISRKYLRTADGQVVAPANTREIEEFRCFLIMPFDY